MALNRMRSPAGGNTVVQVPESNSWLNVAVLGMLTMQFLLVLLVAVKLLFPSMQLGDERVGDLEAQVARLTIAERNQMRMDAQDDVMNAMLKKMGEGPDAFSRIVQDKEEAATWKAAALGQDSRVKQLEGELKLELDAKKKAVKAYDSLLVRNKDLRAQRDKYRTDLKAANKKLGIDTGDEAEGEPQLLWGVAWWWWPIWGAILLALVGGAVLTSIVGPKDEGYGPAARGDDEPPVAFEEVDEDAGNDASPDHNEDSDRADV